MQREMELERIVAETKAEDKRLLAEFQEALKAVESGGGDPAHLEAARVASRTAFERWTEALKTHSLYEKANWERLLRERVEYMRKQSLRQVLMPVIESTRRMVEMRTKHFREHGGAVDDCPICRDAYEEACRNARSARNHFEGSAADQSPDWWTL